MRFFLMLCALLASEMLAACSGTTEPDTPLGSYQLRVVDWPGLGRFRVPAAIPVPNAGDTTRYLDGDFALRADGRWALRVHIRYELVGQPPAEQQLADGGSYLLTAIPGDTSMLTHVIDASSQFSGLQRFYILRGDTLSTGLLLFTR